MNRDEVAPLFDKEVDYKTLMKLSIDHADAVAVQSPKADPELVEYARQKGLEILDYADDTSAYVDAYKRMMTDLNA